MKFNECFTGNGIFQIFKTAFPSSFSELFTETAVSDLDNYTRLKYGDRICVKAVTPETAEEIVKSVIQVNLSNWLRLKNADSAEYDIISNSTEQRTKTGTIERENTGNETTLNAEKCFNDSEFTDSERTGTQNTDNAKDIYNITETATTTGGNVTDKIRNEIKLRREFNLRDYVSAEIVNEITLRIY